MNDYGARIASARRELGLTQEQFADRAGVPVRTVQDIEAGNVGRPQRKTRDKLDIVLGLHPEHEIEDEWTADVRAFLAILGAYLEALPIAERTAMIHDTIRRIAERNQG